MTSDLDPTSETSLEALDASASKAALSQDSDPDAAPILEEELRQELGAFELFFKTFGFKRVHGRVWGLLVLCGEPLSVKQISNELEISQGGTSTTLNELAEWGAVLATFDSGRRCHLHAPVGNALSIVATVIRRREQVALEQFRQTAARALEFIKKRHGLRDPRVLTLRSIIAACDLADSLMGLVFTAVKSALGDPQSLVSRAIGTALKVGAGMPQKLFSHEDAEEALEEEARELAASAEEGRDE